MAASTTTVAAPRLAVRYRTIAMRAAVTIILAATTAWMITKIIDDPTRFFQSAVYGISNGALYALIALGYTLVYGIIELINFAHGDLFMLGTVFSAFLMGGLFAVTEPSGMGWVLFAVMIVLAMIFCGTINVTIEFLAYRRLRRAPRLAPLITAIGMSFILQNIGNLWNGSQQRTWPTMMPDGGIHIGGVLFSWKFMVVVGVTVPILLGLTYIVTKTKVGKAMRATAQDQDAARLMGVNVNRIISFTFGLGGALAGAAGVVYQQTIGTTWWFSGFQLGLIAFTAAVLGGIGNLTGAVLGGVLIGLIQGINDGVGLGQQWSQSVVFTILILVMVFRPSGLLGSPVGDKV